MTHENNQNPDDLNWMEIAREDVSVPSATTPSGIPVIPNVAPGVGGYDDEDDDEDDDDYEDDDDHEDDDHDED